MPDRKPCAANYRRVEIFNNGSVVIVGTGTGDSIKPVQGRMVEITLSPGEALQLSNVLNKVRAKLEWTEPLQPTPSQKRAAHNAELFGLKKGK